MNEFIKMIEDGVKIPDTKANHVLICAHNQHALEVEKATGIKQQYIVIDGFVPFEPDSLRRTE